VTHVSETNLHRYVGDTATIILPVDHIERADVTSATWRALGVVGVHKALASGVQAITGADAMSSYPDAGLGTLDANQAVLVVTLTAADIDSIGVGRWRWQATVGDGSDVETVAHGWFGVSKRIPAPVSP
jgi:hypothetical protein